jgi:hypothetical protein
MQIAHDVLLIESRPSAGRNLAYDLERSGHRVHRCYDHPTPVAAAGAGPLCTAAVGGSCPIDEGIDVALLASGDALARPTFSEGGVSCALRAGVPVVQADPSASPTFGSWVATSTTANAADAVAEAVEAGFATLRHDIADRMAQVLDQAGVEPASVTCRFERDGTRLEVIVSGPEVDRPVQQALGVRVLDAVRIGRRDWDQVTVTYDDGTR